MQIAVAIDSERRQDMKICIYCASSAEISDIYFAATEALAKELVKNKVEVVYGGGAIGLMGKLADTIIENGGTIYGIIPRFMFDKGWAHKKVTDLVVTETMQERKARYLSGIDGIIALPGGSGTLEELLEAITLKRLGQFSKPIIILNTNGFYEPLIQMFQKCANENFINGKDLELWTFANEPSDAMDLLMNV